MRNPLTLRDDFHRFSSFERKRATRACVARYARYSLCFLFALSETKKRGFFASLVRCTISRILSRAAMYLGWLLPTTSSGSPPMLGDTTLHAGRNFAVAPDTFPYQLILADLLASRLGRLCSHPSDYPGGRYPLPFELNHACPDFPLRLGRSGCLAQDNTIPYFTRKTSF